VFTPSYRKKLLFGQIRRHLGTVFHDLARRKECRIEEGHCAECRVQAAQFARSQVVGEGYLASTVGRDEEMIRAGIKNQELADKQLDQTQLKLASS
jgi:putative transposase